MIEWLKKMIDSILKWLGINAEKAGEYPIRRLQRITQLFLVDPILDSCLPIYDVGIGDNVVSILKSGSFINEVMKTDRVCPDIHNKITDNQLSGLLRFAGRTASKVKIEDLILREEGFLEDTKRDLVYTRIICDEGFCLDRNINMEYCYIDGFPYVLLLPDPEHFGVIAKTKDGEGIWFLAANMIVLEDV